MKKMNEAIITEVYGGKTKKCNGCNKKFNTWLTYTYHMVLKIFNPKAADCLLNVIKNPW